PALFPPALCQRSFDLTTVFAAVRFPFLICSIDFRAARFLSENRSNLRAEWRVQLRLSKPRAPMLSEFPPFQKSLSRLPAPVLISAPRFAQKYSGDCPLPKRAAKFCPKA